MSPTSMSTKHMALHHHPHVSSALLCGQPLANCIWVGEGTQIALDALKPSSTHNDVHLLDAPLRGASPILIRTQHQESQILIRLYWQYAKKKTGSNNGVSCCVDREVKAQKFADAMRS
eukprot:1090497-Pelagomonas_calceolata.AAC.1